MKSVKEQQAGGLLITLRSVTPPGQGCVFKTKTTNVWVTGNKITWFKSDVTVHLFYSIQKGLQYVTLLIKIVYLKWSINVHKRCNFDIFIPKMFKVTILMLLSQKTCTDETPVAFRIFQIDHRSPEDESFISFPFNYCIIVLCGWQARWECRWWRQIAITKPPRTGQSPPHNPNNFKWNYINFPEALCIFLNE